jgi:hypothetical protein
MEVFVPSHRFVPRHRCRPLILGVLIPGQRHPFLSVFLASPVRASLTYPLSYTQGVQEAWDALDPSAASGILLRIAGIKIGP